MSTSMLPVRRTARLRCVGWYPEHYSDRFERLARAAEVPRCRGADDPAARSPAHRRVARADGTPVKVVQEMAGHSNPAITQGTFAHVLPGQHETADARLSGLLGLTGTDALTGE